MVSTSSITSITPTATTWPTRPAPKPRRPTFTGGDRWPRSISSTWSRPRWRWTPTRWQRGLFPAEYRDAVPGPARRRRHPPVRPIAVARRRGSAAAVDRRPDRSPTRRGSSASWPARSTALRGFDRFLTLADALLRARPDVLCVVVGDPIVRRGLDVEFHNQRLPRAPARPATRRSIPTGSGSWGRRRPRSWPRSWPPATCTSPRAGPIRWRARCSRRWPPAAWCWHPTPSRTAKSSTQGKPACWSTVATPMRLAQQALAVLADPAAYRPLGERPPRWCASTTARTSACPGSPSEFAALAPARGGWS